MIKQTLFFSTPVCLSLKNCQIVISWKDSDDKVTRPIEDIGCVVLENQMLRLRHVEPRVDHHQRIVPPGGVTVGRAGDENHRVVLSGEAVALQRAGQRFAGQLRGGIDLIGRAGLRMRAGRKRAE